MPKYSFIIPVKEINNYIQELIPKILEIKRDDFEIIIYPNEINFGFSALKTKQIATGNVGPATKRSLAMKDAIGEILVFIDDDAYPEKDLLDLLDKDFEYVEIVAVGGPAITPQNDGFWQKVSGAVFLSALGGSNPERYISVGEKKFVDDWPSVNLSVRKESFIKAGGFDSKYWPGEDTKFCLDLIQRTGGKILYNPNLIVWHHRRAGFSSHLKQVGGYGLHRGFFAKKFQDHRSFSKIKYFIPSAFFLFFILGGIISFFSPIIFKLYIAGLSIYFLALIKFFIDAYKYEKNLLIVFCATFYVFCTHLVYGLRFLQSFLFVRELKSKLR